MAFGLTCIVYLIALVEHTGGQAYENECCFGAMVLSFAVSIMKMCFSSNNCHFVLFWTYRLLFGTVVISFFLGPASRPANLSLLNPLHTTCAL